MKKLLSLLLMLFMGMSMWAGTIVFADLGLENGVQYLDPFDGGDFTVTFAGGGNDGKYYTTGSGIRVYGGGSMTVTAKSGTITEITVTYASGNSYRPNSADVVNVGTYDPETGVWTGSASSVVFTRPSGNGHWRVQKVEVSLSGETPPEPPTPTITEISTVAEFLALENNKEFKFTGSLVCVQDYTAVNASGEGESRYLYAADETGGIVIYNPDENTPTYETKDVISGGWTATKTAYRNLPEATTATDFIGATETRHLDPIEMTINEANNSTNYGAYVIIKKVLIRPQSDNMLMEESGPSTHDESVMITDDNVNDINLYSAHTAPFNLPTDWESNTRYDVVGILGVYNSTQQIYPIGIKLNDETITAIETVDNGVKKVVYYNIQGIESSKPFDGVNIVTIEYDNGTKKINKVIKR